LSRRLAANGTVIFCRTISEHDFRKEHHMTHASTSPIVADQLAPAGVHGPAQLTGVLKAIAHAPSRVIGWFAERRRVSRMITTLEELSDHVLADIGIERSDIRRMARQRRNAAARRA
jgi:uncharacterized protein YjiS (DUF1127 family)